MPDLDIHVKKLSEPNNTMIVTLGGVLNITTIIQLQKELKGHIKSLKNIIIDLSAIQFINSTSLGYLINFADDVSSNEGQFILANVPSKIKDLMDTLEVSFFFKIYKNVPEAVRALKEKTGILKDIATNESTDTDILPAQIDEDQLLNTGVDSFKTPCIICDNVLVVKKLSDISCNKCKSDIFTFEDGHSEPKFGAREVRIDATLNPNFIHAFDPFMIALLNTTQSKISRLINLVELIRHLSLFDDVTKKVIIEIYKTEDKYTLLIKHRGRQIEKKKLASILKANDNLSVVERKNGGNSVVFNFNV